MRGRHRGIEDGSSFQVPKYIEEMTTEMKGGYRGLLRAVPCTDFMADFEQLDQAHEEDAVLPESEGEQLQPEVEEMTPEGVAFLEALAQKRKDQQATPKARTHGAHPQIKWQPDSCGGRPVPMRPELGEKISTTAGQEGNLLQFAGTEPSQLTTRQKPRRMAARKQPVTSELHARVPQPAATSACTAAAAGDRSPTRVPTSGSRRPQPLSFEDDLPESLPLCVTPIRSPSPLTNMEDHRRSPAPTSFAACRPRGAFSPAHGDLQRESSPSGRSSQHRESQRNPSPRGPPDGLRIMAPVLPTQSRLVQIKENRPSSAQAGIVAADQPRRAATPTAFNEDFWSLRDADRPMTPSSVTRADAPCVQMSNSEIVITTAWSGVSDNFWTLNSSIDFERQVLPPPPQQSPPPPSVRAFLQRRSSHAFSESRHDELMALCGSPLSPGERPRRKSLSAIEENLSKRTLAQSHTADVMSTQDPQVDIVADTSPENMQSTVMSQEGEEGAKMEDGDDDEKEKAFPGAEKLGHEAEASPSQREEQLRVAAAQCGGHDGRPMIRLQPPGVPDGSSNVEPRRFPSHDPASMKLQRLDVYDCSSNAMQCGLPGDDFLLMPGNSQSLALEGNSSSSCSCQQEELAQKSQHSEEFVDYDYKVVGAGGVGDVTNGFYRQVGIFTGMPKYKLLGGEAIMYYFGAWKINYRDDTNGWFYLHPDELSQTPPEGMWTTYGYNEGDADPAPTVHMNREPHEPAPDRTQSDVPTPTREMDEHDEALLRRGYSLTWSWKPSAADPGPFQRLVSPKEASRSDEEEEEEERNAEEEEHLSQLQAKGSAERSKDRRSQRLQLQAHNSRQDTLDWDQHRDLSFPPSNDGEEEYSFGDFQECKWNPPPDRPYSQQEVVEPLDAWLMRSQIQEINHDRTGSPLFIGPRSARFPLEDLDAPLAQVLGALERAPAIKDVRRPPSAGRWNRACSTPSPDIRMSPLPTLSPRGCSTTTTSKSGLMLVASSQRVQPPQQVSTDTVRRPRPSTQPLDRRQVPRKALGTSLLCMLPPSRASTRSRTLAQTQFQALQRLRQPCHEERKALPTNIKEELKFDSTLSHSSGSERGESLYMPSVQSSHVYSPSEENLY